LSTHLAKTILLCLLNMPLTMVASLYFLNAIVNGLKQIETFKSQSMWKVQEDNVTMFNTNSCTFLWFFML
jgi:hypothetical protein